MANPFTQKAIFAYYLAFIPLTILVGTLLYTFGIGHLLSVIIAICFGLPMAVVGWSARYMCRVLPLTRTSISTAAPAFAGLIIGASGTWTALFVIVSRSAKWLPMSQLNDMALSMFIVGVLTIAFSLAFHYLVIAIKQVQEAEHSRDEARLLGREAELSALRAQLDPHFLFNSLNSVAALITVDPKGARDMIILMSSFFRSTLAAGKKDSVKLEEELELVDSYLKIEKVRFDERMCVNQNIEESCRGRIVPPLLLQPIVENAIKHGVSLSVEKVNIDINVSLAGDFMKIEIINDFDPDSRAKKSTGLGLATTRERLVKYFGKMADMNVEKFDNKFSVTLKVPNKSVR